MKPGWLVFAVVLAAFLVVRRSRLGREALIGGAFVAAGAAAVGSGIVELPNVEKLIEDVGRTLGSWTYLLVGVLAFLETGAFVGLVAPGETAVLVGGVVAAQGEIDLAVLVALVWTCAVAGDLTSYALGRRLGRQFLVRHGHRLRITEERLQHVEGFFERHGGPTILVGRFIGLVRALAPFLAGASRMPLRRFLPYDVLGSGLWAALFCVLGFVFWHSLGTVTKYVGRGVFLLATLAALVAAAVWVRRRFRDPQFLARHPRLARLVGPLRFVYQRLTPGELGLELTTLLALTAVSGFVVAFLGGLISPGRLELPLDREALDVASRLQTPFARDVAAVFTDLGALPVVFTVVLATAIWAASQRRIIDALTPVVSLLVTWPAVAMWKDFEARPRPADPLVATEGFAYPSGHAAYAAALIACAVVLVRGGSSWALRISAVTVSVAVAVAVALSRVYLRAHYLSDVVGGLALGIAVFALGGIAALVIAHVRHNDSA